MPLKDQFNSTQYSTYINNITANNSYIKINNNHEKGIVDIYNIFDGVLVLFISISSKQWPVASFSERSDKIFLNYCIKGSCEVSLSNELSTCISEDEFSISKSSAIKDFSYPLKQYEGIEIILNINELKPFQDILKNNFDIDINKTLDYYTLNNSPFIAKANPKLRELMKKLLKNKNSNTLFEMRINILDLLYLLSKKEINSNNKKRTYLTSSQTQIAKSVEKLITKDLQKKITIAKLSKMFSVSETSLKTYFKSLYGKNISTYLQEIRINESAKQIAKTKKSISDIAGMVGYENQSKFASVFKSYFKISPIEYRRLNYYRNNNDSKN